MTGLTHLDIIGFEVKKDYKNQSPYGAHVKLDIDDEVIKIAVAVLLVVCFLTGFLLGSLFSRASDYKSALIQSETRNERLIDAMHYKQK